MSDIQIGEFLMTDNKNASLSLDLSMCQVAEVESQVYVHLYTRFISYIKKCLL